MDRREATGSILALAGTLKGSLSRGSTQAGGATESRDILMVVYPSFTALDLVGPHHVLSSLPGYRVKLVWKTKNELLSDTGLSFRPTATFAECVENPAVLFVPGGTQGTLAAMEDREVRDFVASRGAKARFVTSVCTGALILGAAGLLKGYKATTHWLVLDALKAFGAEPVANRVVEDRNRITGGGVTAGIDFGLSLAAKLANEPLARGIQLVMEYDPQPPYRSGSPKTADPETVQSVKDMFQPFRKRLDIVTKKVISD